jgi:ABC-type antimicrobial peptide transport system permease subunit
VVAVVAAMFLLSSLIGVTYSFISLLQRKLGEIGILRAYGASRQFILGRFALEVLAVCCLGAVASCLLFAQVVLPVMNRHLREMFPSLFEVQSQLLTFGASSIWISAGVLVLALIVVGLIVWMHIRRKPAELLGMRE